jgi:hypothetical protein
MVRSVTVRWGDRVNMVCVNGGAKGVCLTGDKAAPNEKTLPLDDDEYLMGFVVRYGSSVDHVWIRTNKRKLGGDDGFGGDGGGHTVDVLAPDGCHVVGLYGRRGNVVDQLGVCYEKLPPR